MEEVGKSMIKSIEGGGRKSKSRIMSMVRQLEGLEMSDNQDPEKGGWYPSQSERLGRENICRTYSQLNMELGE